MRGVSRVGIDKSSDPYRLISLTPDPGGTAFTAFATFCPAVPQNWHYAADSSRDWRTESR